MMHGSFTFRKIEQEHGKWAVKREATMLVFS